MQGRPFALLGVNSDPKKKVKDAIKRENITWRSWWDGGNTRGPIASFYGVRGWPTIYVVDHQGRIRYQNVRGESLTKAVEELVLLAEAASDSDANEYPIVGQFAPVLREWKDKSGKFSVKAEFVKFRDGEAHLKKEDNEVVQVPAAKLCNEDQQFIRDTMRARRGKK